jgi:hypothetical protein
VARRLLAIFVVPPPVFDLFHSIPLDSLSQGQTTEENLASQIYRKTQKCQVTKLSGDRRLVGLDETVGVLGLTGKQAFRLLQDETA